MSLFERFDEPGKKEEAFREEFIKPLLVRLGFVGISNRHGSQEFGKDYVFSELDRFGHFRHMAVQAKHVEKINQGSIVFDLLSQVKQCFNTPYFLPVSPHEERRVAAVYVFNTGEITANAETQIRDGLANEQKANVHFFSGPQLEILNNVNVYRDAEEVRRRLVGLKFQLSLNILIWQDLITFASSTTGTDQCDIRRGIIHGIEEYLTLPFVTNHLSENDIVHLWQLSKIIEMLVLRFALVPKTPDRVNDDKPILKDSCQRAIAHAERLIVSIHVVLSGLPPQVI